MPRMYAQRERLTGFVRTKKMREPTADSNIRLLTQTLGLTDGMVVWFSHMPSVIRSEIQAAGLVLSEEAVPTPGLNLAYIFVRQFSEAKKQLPPVRDVIDAAGYIWISWPRGSTAKDCDITEQAMRDLAASLDLEASDIIAVADDWCALKLMLPAEKIGG